MIVVHVAWVDNQLVSWGESPRAAAAASGGDAAPGPPEARPRKGRRAAAPRVAPPLYPYDAGAARLAEALSQAVAGLSVSARVAETFVAWLPTIDENPVPSSPLVADPAPDPQGNGKATARPEPA